MGALVGLEPGDVSRKRRIAIAELLELLAIMGVDLVLDRGGAGHGGGWSPQGGGGAQDVPGDRPQRLEQGRADSALNQQGVEMGEMVALLSGHAGDQRR